MRIRALKKGRWKVEPGQARDVAIGDVLDLPNHLASYLLSSGMAAVAVLPENTSGGTRPVVTTGPTLTGSEGGDLLSSDDEPETPSGIMKRIKKGLS